MVEKKIREKHQVKENSYSKRDKSSQGEGTKLVTEREEFSHGKRKVKRETFKLFRTRTRYEIYLPKRFHVSEIIYISLYCLIFKNIDFEFDCIFDPQ